MPRHHVHKFDASETGLSPKDVPTISLGIRIGLFTMAWVVVLWFVIGPWFPALRFWFGISVIPFQLYWTYIMLWVCRWAMVGTFRVRAQFKQYMTDLRAEVGGHRHAPPGYQYPEVIHWVILPNYKESIGVMRASLNALAAQSIGAHRICIVIASEAAEDGVLEKTMRLAREFPEFRKIVVNVHQLREGECAGKSSNLSSVFRALCANTLRITNDERLRSVVDAVQPELESWHEVDDERKNDDEPYAALLDRGILTVMDADSIFHSFYLYAVERSYHFSFHSVRKNVIWQCPIANYMNIHRIPTFSRVMSVAVSLHELASLTHPTKPKLPFSSFSITADLVFNMGGWSSDVLTDDWHTYLRAWSATKGKAFVTPIFLPMICYSTECDTWFQSLMERYHQAVRHSWAQIETASLYSMYRDLPQESRPSPLSFTFIMWKMFKLHFLGVFQTPLSFAAAVVQFLMMWQNGYNIFDVPSLEQGLFLPEDKNAASWLVFAIMSILMGMLPISAILSSIAHYRYENCIHEIFGEAYSWSDMRGVEARIEKNNANRSIGSEDDPDAAVNWTYKAKKQHKKKKKKKRRRKMKGNQSSENLLSLDEREHDYDDDDSDDSDDEVLSNGFAGNEDDTCLSSVEDSSDDSQYMKNGRVAEVPFDTFGERRSPPLRPRVVVEYCKKFLTPMPPTKVTRVKQVIETLVIMPLSGLLYGFLPALKCHTMLPFKRYFKFNVSAKPTSEDVV